MKNSPYQVSHGDHYNLANTTPELLKFQLHEQTRLDMDPAHALQPLLMDLSFSSHLQTALLNKSISVDDDTDRNDEFSRAEPLSGMLTPSSDVLEPWKAVADLKTSNYLNLKVLIENSVFDTLKMSPKSVLSLHKVKKIKLLILDKQEHKEYLEQRISISNQFCSTLLENAESSPSELDAGLLLKILKQTIDLQLQLMSLLLEVDLLSLKLHNHNLACLMLGYVEDVKLSSLGSTEQFATAPHSLVSESLSQQAFDSIFSHVAALAAQKNVFLPLYHESEDAPLQNKIQWAQSCISALVDAQTPPTSASGDTSFDQNASVDNSVLRDHSFLSASPYKSYSNAKSLDKTISEYRIALNDLRFSHEYFMKEYEYLKENSLKTIQDYRKKNTFLEKEVEQLRSGSSGAQQDSPRDSLQAKDKEIAKLRKELNLLKIEYLGNKSPRNSVIVNSSLLSNIEDEDDRQLTHSQSSLNYKSHGLSSMSNAILRKEFKKIVSDIQDQYEVELGEERHKRRNLEERLQKLEN